MLPQLLAARKDVLDGALVPLEILRLLVGS